MKRWFSGFLGGVIFLVPMICAQAAPSIQVAGMEGRIQSHTAVLSAVFGNREQGIDLEIAGAAALSGSLRADMFQVSGTLAMPLIKDGLLLETLALTGATSQQVRVMIKFPDVKKQAEILVRFSLFSNAPGAKAAPLGELRFSVFPASVTKELTNLLQPKPDARVIVFGPGQPLRHFLSGLKIAFEDGGTDTPERFDPSRLYFGDLATHEQYQQAEDRSAGARIVLFAPDESLPPGGYAERSSAGVHVQVTSRLLDNIAVDPQAQLALIKIIHLLSASSSSAN